MNRERYVIRSGNRIGNRSLIDPENKTIHSEVFIVGQRKERAKARDPFLVPTTADADSRDPRDRDSHGRSRLSRTAEINELYVRCSEGMRKGKSLRCSDFPVVKVRLMYVASCKLPWATFKRMHTSTDFVRGFSCSNYSSLMLIISANNHVASNCSASCSISSKRENVKVYFTLAYLSVRCS